MDNHERQEFDLDDIMKEFGTEQEDASLPMDQPREEEAAPQPQETAPEGEEAAQEPAEVEELPQQMPELQETQRFEPAEAAEEPENGEHTVPDDDTKDIDALIAEAMGGEAPPQEPEEEPAPKIVYNPRTRLRELKKKLVAGPERRYYELAESGIGRLQMAILLNVLVVALCAGTTTMSTLGMIPENRLRFTIFTQVLAMLISALLGYNQILDGLGEIFKGRFTINTLLGITFAACCVDALFCLQELRIPCCAAFSLEITLALLARYHRRSIEMAQMDTMRKAVRLNGLVRTEDYLEGKAGVLRRDGEVEDFMDTYNRPSDPEKLQSVYAFLSLLLCAAIAVFAGMTHGTSMGVQIFSTALLVAVPASFFIATTRPMAVLEKRLHMVGTVLCGWRGVKALSKKAAFPLLDGDLFPQGSTKLNGVKFYGDRNPDQVVSCSASLIFAAESGLTPLFRQLLTSRGGRECPVSNFQDYGTGGIGGEIDGEPVLLGSADFLRAMDVQIPEGSMVAQAVYAAIDGQLAAVYAISYAKMRSAAAGLVTLCGSRKVTPVLLCDDFMLTESFLMNKFEVRTKRMVFPPKTQRQVLKAVEADPEAPVLALATREELISYAYAITGSRALRTATKLGVAIHLIGGILGLLIMAALAFLGSTELLTPTNVLLYQLVWLIPGWLITEWTRTV